MNLKEFQQEAIKTESKIDSVNVNLRYLSALLQISIATGNLLDQIKKNVFYNKPFDDQERAKHIASIIEAMDSKSLFIDNPEDDKKVMHVNTRIFHAIIGITTESTELLENLVSEKFDVINMLEEAGDLGWYLSVMFDEVDTNFEVVMTTIIEKLKLRYPNKFKSEDAINRNIDAERKILETINHSTNEKTN
jgi:NTP pyrophosphatase (non-canonical NTP hydrolase)